MTGLQSREIQRSLGGDILETLSRNAVASPYDATIELINNAWDADSPTTQVWVTDDKITIVDQGCGMSPKDLDHFYRVGDSIKKQERMTPLGRPKLGRFGLATLCLRTLGKEYSLITTKDNEQTQVTERFSDNLTLEDRLKAETKKLASTPSGTLIELRDLLVQPATSFTSESVRTYVATTLSEAILSQMRVEVNGMQINARKIENASQFEVDKMGKYAGKLLGKIYLTGHPMKDHGIYIMVNGRKIGDPKKIVNLNELNDSTARRIYAQIEAAGMESFIRQDRGGFEPGQAYNDLCSLLLDSLREVNQFATQESHTAQRTNLARMVKPLTGEVTAKLKNARIPEAESMTIEMAEHLPGFVAARLTGKVLYLNKAFPQFSPDRIPNKHALRQSMLLAAVDAIALARTEQHSSSKPLELYQQQRTLMLSSVFPISAAAKVNGVDIFDNLRYDLPVLANKSKLNLATVRYFMNGGLIKEKQGTVRGGDFKDVLVKTKGLMPLPIFIHEHINTENESINLERFTEIFSKIGDLKPFVLHYGEPGCYFIEMSCMSELQPLLQGIDLRTTRDHSKPFTNYANQFCTISDLTTKLNMRQGSIAEVINYAHDFNIPIKTHTPRSEIAYHYGEFITAMQYLRGNLTLPQVIQS